MNATFTKKIVFTVLVIALFVSNGLSQELINYDWPETIEVSPYYSVKVHQGAETEDVFTHLSKPNQNVDPNYPNEGSGVTAYLNDRTMSFVQFAFSGQVIVEVTKKFGSAASRVEISPKGLGVNPIYFDGETVKFLLEHKPEVPLYLSVEFVMPENYDDDRSGGDNIKNGLVVFADKPETNAPSKSSNSTVVYSNSANLESASVIYFEGGKEYNLDERFNSVPGQIGQMPLKENQRVYIEGGAVVNGAVISNRNNGIWLYGRGIITGRKFAWHWFRDETGKKDAYLNLVGTDGASVEGIVIENPTHHTLPMGNDASVKNIKILGWASNHDGVRPSGGSVVDGIFIKTSDDYDYARDPHEVKNSIFWPMNNGASGMMGWNNLGTGYAEYRNNYYINAEWSTPWPNKENTGILCGSKAVGGIKLQDNVLENLTIEDKTNYLVNSAIREDGEYGFLKNFLFKNITVEYLFQTENGTLTKQIMRGRNQNWIEGWTFTNLIVAGVLVTWDNYRDYFDLDLEGSNGDNVDQEKYVRNITFNSEGNLYTISVTANAGGTFTPFGENGEITCLGGKDQVVNIIPDNGNKIKDVKIDGESKGRLQYILLSEISGDHSIEIEFASGADYFDYPTSTGDEITASSFELFPNPSSEKVTVSFPEMKGQIFIKLLNMNGQLIRSLERWNSDQVELMVAGLKSGIYLVEVETPDGMMTEKLMIK